MSFIRDIKRRGFFITAEEARDKSRVEQLSCLRYVHPESHCIVEHFVGFTACCKLDATSLATQVIGEVNKLGLDINCIVMVHLS